MLAVWIIASVLALLAVAYSGAGAVAWVGVLGASLAFAWGTALFSMPVLVALTAGTAVLALPLAIGPLRRALLSKPLLGVFRKVLPQMSQTEQDALDAGTVWWDGELFSGKPDWNKLLKYPAPKLSAEEQAFLDNETETLCSLTSDWKEVNEYQDLPPEVWQYIKDKGFLGLIIPKKYGGKEFSGYAHSQIVQKLSSRAGATAVSVIVPNSLGPAELLLHYGTEEQKNHYLPRLAKGLEIPCFALTNPNAGSDAASIPDFGIVCKGEWQGREVLGLRVTWEKRYITLGPIATVLGLAFKAYDPDRLLGDKEDLGITCALIPTNHPGVVIGRRHMPLNAVFQNGPNSGKDVFIPMDWVIGGRPQVGHGWKMLMNCLAAGRGISLPSSNTGMSKLAVRGTGGYARVRSQFKLPIGKFEGIEEPLARMGGHLYMIDALRTFAANAVDLGEKPAVIAGIAKYHVTERARQIVIDGMDIQGGKGICLGPNNILGRAYQQAPIAITVEGANIMTRSLIIFGQGAIRCHPWVLKEIAATRETDSAKAVQAFDHALFGHMKFTVASGVRSLFMGLTGAKLVGTPDGYAAENRHYLRQLTRFSSALALVADVSMLTMGGDLKRREKISARLGDTLSMLVIGSAALRKFELEGRQSADRPLLDWGMQDTLWRIQEALLGVCENYPSRFIGALLKRVVFPFGAGFRVPSDRLGHQVARLLIEPSATRDRLTAGMHLPKSEAEPMGCLELAVEATIKAEQIEQKIRAAVKAGKIKGKTPDEWVSAAAASGVITADEHAHLKRTRQLTDQVVRVDDFPQDFGLSEHLSTLLGEQQREPTALPKAA